MQNNQDEDPSGYKQSTLDALKETDMEAVLSEDREYCPSCGADEDTTVWDDVDECYRCEVCDHIF